MQFKVPSAICFDSDQSKILLPGNESLNFDSWVQYYSKCLHIIKALKIVWHSPIDSLVLVIIGCQFEWDETHLAHYLCGALSALTKAWRRR